MLDMKQYHWLNMEKQKISKHSFKIIFAVSNLLQYFCREKIPKKNKEEMQKRRSAWKKRKNKKNNGTKIIRKSKKIIKEINEKKK